MSRVLYCCMGAWIALACNPARVAPADGEEGGAMRVQLLAPADVTRIALAVQPAGIARDLSAAEYDEATGAFTTTLAVPVGAHTISAAAYAGAALIGTASAPVSVAAGATATVHLTIVDSRPPPPQPDRAPIITSLVVPVATLAVGASTTVSAAATDLDGDPVAFAWTAAPAGCGTFGDGAAAATTFTARAVGTCTLTVTASANGKGDADSVAVVVTAASGDLVVSGTVVTRPVVSSVRVDTTMGSCTVDRASAEGVCPTTAVSGTASTVYVGWKNWRTPPYAVAATLGDSCGGAAQATSLLPGAETTTQAYSWTPSAPQGARSACAITATLTVTGLPAGTTLVDSMAIGIEVTRPPPP